MATMRQPYSTSTHLRMNLWTTSKRLTGKIREDGPKRHCSSTAAVATAVVTAVVAVPVAAAATMGAAGPAAVLGAVVVGKYVIKIIWKRKCKATIDATEEFAKSTLGYYAEQAGRNSVVSLNINYRCSAILIRQKLWQSRSWN